MRCLHPVSSIHNDAQILLSYSILVGESFWTEYLEMAYKYLKYKHPTNHNDKVFAFNHMRSKYLEITLNMDLKYQKGLLMGCRTSQRNLNLTFLAPTTPNLHNF